MAFDLSAFTKAGTFTPSTPSENIPIIVHHYDINSQDPAEHAVIGTRLDDPSQKEAIRFSLAPNRRENAARERPSLYFFATDPAQLVNGDTTKLVALLNKTPAHKCHTPPGGVLLIEGARPVDGQKNAYAARWINRLSSGPTDTDHAIQVGYTTVLPLREGKKPFQAARWFHPEDATLVAKSDELLASLSAILDTDYRVGSLGVMIRLHQPNSETGEIEVRAADVIEFRRKKVGELYVDPTPADSITLFKEHNLGKLLLSKPDYGADRIELMPVSTVAFGPEVIKKTLANNGDLTWPFMAERDNPNSLGIALSTLALYRIPESDGALIATRAIPVKRQIFSADDLPSPHHRPLNVPAISSPTADIEDDIPL
jgi:hypothetical protein